MIKILFMILILLIGFIGLLFIIGIPSLFTGAYVADKYDEHKGTKKYKKTFECPICGSNNLLWYKAGTKKGTQYTFDCWNCKRRLKGKI